MRIDRKYDWFSSFTVFFYIIMSAITVAFKKDHFMVPIQLGVALSALILLVSSGTWFDGDTVSRKILWVTTKRLRLEELSRICPHKKNGRWGYGTVIELHDVLGAKLTLQPNNGPATLLILRKFAPQAQFLF